MIMWHQVVNQEGKNSAICMNKKIKCYWRSGGYFEPLSGFIGGPGGKALGKFAIFSLKLIDVKFLR